MGRRPLKQGEQVSASDYESIAKAVFGAYGTNGIDLRVVGGKLQASGGTPPGGSWWNVRSKPGDPSKLQVSGGFVVLDNGGSTAYPVTSGGPSYFGFSHGVTGGDPTLWTDVTPFAVGDGADGSIYVVQLACDPYDELLFCCDISEADHTGTYPKGAYEWRRVGTYTQISTGVYGNAKRAYFGGSDIHITVVPPGTLRMFASGAVPPGWKALDGTGGAVNAALLGTRQNVVASLLAGLGGALDSNVSAPSAYHATDKIDAVAVTYAMKL